MTLYAHALSPIFPERGLFDAESPIFLKQCPFCPIFPELNCSRRVYVHAPARPPQEGLGGVERFVGGVHSPVKEERCAQGCLRLEERQGFLCGTSKR
ncbi:hypothetical protein DPMN_176232 [Dreissena polymorpha]|uniref:Uncharacterized protein n=1 Tax=Dreissena polymorpha TaxID=45954 RepID=A0A9D4E9J1_DREPO|nr:hypothetical protein DPMN_176232 [Dreissena polymorpha]